MPLAPMNGVMLNKWFLQKKKNFLGIIIIKNEEVRILNISKEITIRVKGMY